MSDVGPIIPLSSGRSFGDKSPEELEAMLDALNMDGTLQDETVPVPEAPPEPASEPAVEAQADPVPETEPEPEEDEAALESEGERLKREKLEAKLELLEAHNSRLAGKLGFFEQQLKSVPRASEPYEPQTQEEMDRLGQLEQRFAQSEAVRTQTEVDQAVESAINALDTPEVVQTLSAEIAAVAPKYAEQLAAARTVGDPRLARQEATAIGRSVLAEARELHWENRHKALIEKRASTAGDSLKAKKAAAPSASGTVPAPQAKPKTFADLTPSEADAWLRANVR